MIQCHDGYPSADVWKSGDDCVGLTDGPYAFGMDEFGAVMRVIDEQNRSAAEKCDPNGTPVTLGVLLTMTDDFAGSRALHELEGMAAGQRAANGTGCLHPIRLTVGHVGKYDEHSAAPDVARRLADRPGVVAVAGVGLSHQLSADVADVLAAARIPMVSDLITAEGFDQNGSQGDRPTFDECDQGITYPRGVGRDFYYRVAFRSAAQLAALGAVVTTRPDFIAVPTGGSDPYTCTTLPLMQRQFGEDITEVRFDTEDASTVSQTAQRVCGEPKDVTVAYIARGRDLGQFLYSLDEIVANGQCAAPSVTVVSTSSGNRLRTGETDPRLEDLRIRALTSVSFTSGTVRLVLPLVAGADKLTPRNPRFADFEAAFAEAGFDPAHIDDGWAVNAFDALTTISTALRTLPAGRPVQRGQINTAISGLTSAERSVPGAGGPISFDNSGNRTDGPPVIRLCPLPASPGAQPPRTTSVVLEPGQPVPACPGT
jgi:ABC-type branched-subunit amino acid transport system substrate-binding protein